MSQDRKTLDQLADELLAASDRYHHARVRQVETGEEYRIVGVHFRESDMAICVEYTPIRSRFCNCVKFARSIGEMEFGTKFVFFEEEGRWAVSENGSAQGAGTDTSGETPHSAKVVTALTSWPNSKVALTCSN